MKNIEIYEPAMCCTSGVCGPTPDKSLMELQDLCNQMTKVGVKVDRHAINKAPLAFAQNKVVKEFLTQKGPDKLPITLFNGEIIKEGSYPTFLELLKFVPEILKAEKNGQSSGFILG